jgi:hypothetical protein
MGPRSDERGKAIAFQTSHWSDQLGIGQFRFAKRIHYCFHIINGSREDQNGFA